MGVRYNAKKNQIGMYHSTPIYQFRMKCHLCDNWFDIHTDPENSQYIIAAGARKKVEEYDPKDIGLIDLPDDEEKERLRTDVFYRLEHQQEDEKKVEESVISLEKIQDYNNQVWSDPYTANQILRQRFRAEKKVNQESEQVRNRLNLSIPILAPSSEDSEAAKAISWDGNARLR
jgi:coiled-coil domain-containing protein 130